MRKQRILRAAVALAGSAIILVAPACASRGRVYVRVGPPAPIVELRIDAPGPDFVWIAGYFRWDSRQYVWVPGHWARRPHARAIWVPGRWVQHGRRGWYYVEGHWR